MFDLVALAYQADLTRVFTFMMAREASMRRIPNLGISEPHHSTSHHGAAGSIPNLAKINTYHMSLFASSSSGSATPDGDGSLLDHSLILFGSGMSEANTHSRLNIPTLLVGGGGAGFKGNRHIQSAAGDAVRQLPADAGQHLRVRARALRHAEHGRAYVALNERRHETREFDLDRHRRGVLAATSAAANSLPLIDAVKAGNVETVRALLKQRVDVNAALPDGTTALHWAVQTNSTELARCCLRRVPRPTPPIATV